MRRKRRVRTIAEKQHRSLRMWGVSILALTFLLVSNTCEADTVTQVADLLTQEDSWAPMAPGVAMDLAQNLMTAQEDSSYAANEPDSLSLSETAVLRAIMLESSLFGVTEIVADPASLAWLQSEIAIDDRAGVTITINGEPCNPDVTGGCIINFGEVPVPEPGELILSLAGLDALFLAYWLKRRKYAE